MTTGRRSPSTTPRDASAEARARLEAHLARAGLKHSRPREAVVDAFLSTSGHVSVEEMTAILRSRGSAVAYSTVYRTMKLLAECGLAAPHEFGDGQTRYERAPEGAHHDHLICTECGAILEFEDDGIEKLQQAVAKRHGFRVASHKMELYGTCAACSSGAHPRESGGPARGAPRLRGER